MDKLKPYWVIITSIVIVVIALILVDWHFQSNNTLIAIHSGDYNGQGFVYWPISGKPTECLLVPAGTFFIFIAISVFSKDDADNRSKDESISHLTIYTLLLMVILSVFALVFLILSAIGDPAVFPEQIATAQIQSTNYYLVDIYSWGGGNQYVLIQCQLLNMNCQIAYKSKRQLLGEEINNIKLQTISSSHGDVITLLDDNKTVYTSE